MTNQSTHPLFLTAAGAVIVTCSVAVASMAGWLPDSNAQSSKSQASQIAEKAEPQASPTAKQSQLIEQAKLTTANPKPEIRYVAAQPAYQPAPKCTSDCGQVTQVRPIQTEGEGTGLGAVAGGVAGAAIGNQMGGGNGKKVMTAIGAIGGAILGNHIEKQKRAVQSYEVVVAFNDGTSGRFQFDQQPYWQPGDRVKVVNGRLTADL